MMGFEKPLEISLEGLNSFFLCIPHELGRLSLRLSVNKAQNCNTEITGSFFDKHLLKCLATVVSLLVFMS